MVISGIFVKMRGFAPRAVFQHTLLPFMDSMLTITVLRLPVAITISKPTGLCVLWLDKTIVYYTHSPGM